MRGFEDIVNRVPVSVVWEITLACDLACQHCGSRAGRRRRDELNTAEALDLVEQIAELGARDVGLIGGEAYLRKDWLDIVAAIRAAGMRCDLQTGGRNLTEERVARAAAAGLSGVGISLDGIGATHDAIRGVPGSFELALAALRRVRAHGLSSAVNTTINARSLPQLRELMDIIIDAGAINWQLAIMTAMGNAADHPELLLQPWQMLEVMPLLAELAVEGRKRGLFLQPASNVGYYGPYESTIRNIINDEIHFHGCNAGDTVMGIEADGTIKSCPGLPQPLRRRQYPANALARDLGERRSARLCSPPNGRRPVGLLPHLLLRGNLHGRLHLDGARPDGPPRQQPDVLSPGARDGPQGPPRAPGEGEGCRGSLVRSWRVRDRRRGCRAAVPDRISGPWLNRAASRRRCASAAAAASLFGSTR